MLQQEIVRRSTRRGPTRSIHHSCIPQCEMPITRTVHCRISLFDFACGKVCVFDQALQIHAVPMR
jgi:hypothetical protein